MPSFVSDNGPKRTLADLCRAREAAGVRFVGSARDRPGARLAKPSRSSVDRDEQPKRNA
jgi:hypothetical protein